MRLEHPLQPNLLHVSFILLPVFEHKHTLLGERSLLDQRHHALLQHEPHALHQRRLLPVESRLHERFVLRDLLHRQRRRAPKRAQQRVRRVRHRRALLKGGLLYAEKRARGPRSVSRWWSNAKEFATNPR